MEKIVWRTKEVEMRLIRLTKNNFKIKTGLGKERLHNSVKKFGLASSVVVNALTKGGYDLIDGNSRVIEQKEKGVKKIIVSYPSRILTPKEYKEMSAMFDFAKAGEVDEERIMAELGTNKDFFDAWGLKMPKEMVERLESIGGRNKVVEVMTSNGKGGKGEKVILRGEEFQVTLFYTPTKEEEFRKMEGKLVSKLNTESVSDTVFETMRRLIKELKIK